MIRYVELEDTADCLALMELRRRILPAIKSRSLAEALQSSTK